MGDQKHTSSSSDSEWDDDVQENEKVEYICVCRVLQDFVPSTHKHLTLFQDDLVYVYSKDSKVRPGWWEGEARGVYGVFPPDKVVEIKV